MEFVFRDAGGARDCELSVVDPTARVAELAAVLGADPAALAVHGRVVAGSVGLRASGLVTGSTVAPADPPPPAAAEELSTMEVRVVGGLDAGARLPLPPGETLVGRGNGGGLRIAHSSISRRHAMITVTGPGAATVTDLGSRNGVDVNGVVVAEPTGLAAADNVGIGGAALLRVGPVPDPQQRAGLDVLHQARHGWRIPFQRQARTSVPPPWPLAVPAPPEQSNRSTFMYTSLLAPVGIAVLTVVMFHDLRFAALALLWPVGFIAAMVEERLRGRGGRRRSQRAYRADLRRLAADLADARLAELYRRRAGLIDPAEAAFRAEQPGARLWERRAGDPDFLALAVGAGDQPWQPELTGLDPGAEIPPEVSALLAAHAELPRVPVAVDLATAGVLGIEGNREAALAAARAALCQAAVAVGPADLAIATFTQAVSAAEWDWTKWLPHALDRAQGTSRLIAVGRAEADALAAQLLAAHPFAAEDSGALLVLVDGATLLEGRNCPLRELVAGRAGTTRAIVLADPLPAQCAAVLTVRPSGAGELRLVATAERRTNLLVNGQSTRRSAAVARALARFEDPEVALAGAGLPAQTALLPLLDLPALTVDALARRWQAGARSLRARAVLGVTETGRYEIDLDDDGPHGLIAGATGSGKSELLRSLVTALAMGNDPDHLVFVLVDYKGGGALDDCAALPHVVGLVTDLDEQLSRRALRCLEAELRHRERCLRAAGVSDFRAYQRLRDGQRPDLEPMPRMAVVIDEFATLVKALPSFVDSLVDVAQRGRSLGVHLIIATQRPAGSVSDAIKANVKLRIALRVETREDSADAIDSAAAAGIGPRQWGRAFRRVGRGEVEAVQTALVSTVTDLSGGGERLRLRPFAIGAGQAGARPAQEPATAGSGPTDLRRLVTLAADTFAAGGFAPPRSPWPDPLPRLVPSEDCPATAEAGLQTPTPGLPTVVLADDPDGQRHVWLGWDPAAGNLAVFGAVGSGTTTALASVLLAWTRALPPEQLRVYVLDHGSGDLAGLADLPHTGGYVRTDDGERLVRLVGLLGAELRRRKGSRRSGVDPQRWLVAVDGLGALLAGAGGTDPVLSGLLDQLAEVYADGPAVGISVVGTVDRAGGLPGSWLSRTAQRVLLPLADPLDYGMFGLPLHDVPAPAPGRGVIPASRQVVQVVAPRDGLAAAVAAVRTAWPASAPVRRLAVLPEMVRLGDLPAPMIPPEHPWQLPVGLRQDTLEPATLLLHEHDHVLILGPRRSGRSTLLGALADSLRAASAPVFAYAPRSSPVRCVPPPVQVVVTVAELAAALDGHDRAPVVLVDDADTVEDLTGLFTALATHADPAVHVIAAARNDGPARSSMHWLAAVRQARCGVLLVPHFLDGDLLGADLPRRSPLPLTPGRGYLVSDGSAVPIQAAVPVWQGEPVGAVPDRR